jgi:putative membrane fusion protein
LKKGKKILAILAVIAVLIYVIYSVYMLIVHPTDTYVITQGTLTQEDESIGYIIRNEKIVKGEDYQNGIYAIASEGQRVAKNESIFRYYSDSEKEIKTQISGLNYKIQELLEQEKNLTPSADIKVIEKEIEGKLQKLNTLTNYQEVVENKKNIDNLINKKINFIGDVTENQEIKRLIKEKNECEEKLKNGAEYQKAEMAGIVSYRVDGVEEKLTTNNFNQITENYLENLDLKTGKIISTSNECGKVIDNFKCYIAATLKSKNAMQAKVGDDVQIRISNKEEFKAEIVQINEENGKRTIIFELDKMAEDFINHRKMIIDVIWWDASGLKIPKQAIVTENGLNYVIRNKAGIQSKILVKVEIQTDKFAIIAPYNKDELRELGFSSEEIKKYKKITNYDEIMINK